MENLNTRPSPTLGDGRMPVLTQPRIWKNLAMGSFCIFYLFEAFSKKLSEAGKILKEKSGDGQGGVIAVVDEDEWSDEDDS